jgi:diacylglycerol kinase
MEKSHSLLKSFKFALDGIRTSFIKERNFRIQVAVGILILPLGIALKISVFEWIELILTISLVIILELLNTALESIVDMVSPEIQESAKIAKDTSAAAVLVAAAASVAIGVLIFLPKLLSSFAITK